MVQAARNKLDSWCQLKDVGSFEKTILSIVMDIPDMTESENNLPIDPGAEASDLGTIVHPNLRPL